MNTRVFETTRTNAEITVKMRRILREVQISRAGD